MSIGIIQRPHAAAFAAALIVAAVLDTGQAVAQAPAAGAPPTPPGRMIDVGGRRMHIDCTGKGPRTVVLAAGAGAFSVDWYLVQRSVESFARVCSYDRAGLGWSELGPLPRTTAQAVHDLHALLDKAGERGPFVLVGHSAGGVLVRNYALQYPADVAGMLLLDPPSPTTLQNIDGKWVREFWLAKPRAVPRPRETIADSERTLSPPELEGARQFWAAVGQPAIDGPLEHLPPDIQKLRLWAMSQPSSVTSDFNPYSAEELLLLLADQVRNPHSFGNRPLIVIRRTPDTPPANAAPNSGPVLRIKERPDELKAMADLSTNHLVGTADSTRHEIQLDRPALVVDAIRAILESDRTHSALRPVAGIRQ